MRLTTILAGTAALALSLGSVLPALAVCAGCNTSVRLDTALAGCFVERLDAELAKVASSATGVALIDLRDCSSRGSQPTGNPVGTSPIALDTKFIADAAGIKCLGDQIAAVDDTALDPGHVFDLAKACPAP